MPSRNDDHAEGIENLSTPREMVFNNNTEVIVYTIIMDEISDDPDTPGLAAHATVNATINALQNAGKEVATEYNL